MIRIVRFMLVIVLVATPIVALGAEVQGKVKTVDTSDRVVTLEDGTRISVPDAIALDNVKEGAEVSVSYEERDGKNQATDIQAKQPRGRGSVAVGRGAPLFSRSAWRARAGRPTSRGTRRGRAAARLPPRRLRPLPCRCRAARRR